MRTAVVISGAVARGAYEAGALAEILAKKLKKEDLPETLFLGTSAGAINAVLWAGLANGERTVAEIGEEVCQVWERLKDTDVFAPVRSAAGAAAALALGSGKPLFDTGPLKQTVDEYMARLTIADNIANGHIGGVAVAATLCGTSIAGARSDVFYQAKHAPKAESKSSALRFFPTSIGSAHVRASSAVPLLFEPVAIDGAYYVDGGVRLNTPIAPAIDFGADRIIVVSSHTTAYPDRDPLAHAPAGIDSFAMMLHSVLADGTIEDLRRVRRINRLLKEPGINASGLKKVELIEVSPPPGTLAKLARSALNRAGEAATITRPGAVVRYGRYKLLEELFERLGTGPGLDEMMSYVLFDPGYFELQIERGRSDARAAADWST